MKAPMPPPSSGQACCGIDLAPWKLLPAAVYDLRDLVQMGIDFVRDLAEVTPLLTKFRRFVGGLQEIAVLPLDVVHDTPAIEAAMQADGDESRLTRHEAGTLAHHGHGFGLLAHFRLDDRDLSDRLIIG